MDKKKTFFGKLKSIHDLEDWINEETENLPENHETVSGVGAVLFAHPNDILASQHLIPKLRYLHYRSDAYLNFLIAGMVPSQDKDKYLEAELVKILSVEGVDWYFSEAAFVSVIRYFELSSSWNYGGGADLIVLDYKIKNRKINWNFGDAFQINLEKAIGLNAISSVHSFLETLILFSKNEGNSLSAYDVAMDGFKRQGKKTLLKLFSQFFSPHLVEEFEKLQVFIPLDINKRQK